MTTHAQETGLHRSVSAPWRSWQNWVNVVLGIYLALAPFWTKAAPMGWFVTLGVLVIAAGLWAEASPSASAPAWTGIVLGAVVFLAPWIGGFAAVTGAAWTAWVVGVAVVVFAVYAMAAARKTA